MWSSASEFFFHPLPGRFAGCLRVRIGADPGESDSLTICHVQPGVMWPLDAINAVSNGLLPCVCRRFQQAAGWSIVHERQLGVCHG